MADAATAAGSALCAPRGLWRAPAFVRECAPTWASVPVAPLLWRLDFVQECNRDSAPVARSPWRRDFAREFVPSIAPACAHQSTAPVVQYTETGIAPIAGAPERRSLLAPPSA